jgi:hypothetical protein
MKRCFLFFVLTSALWPQTIDGDLVDALTGAPVAGARVRRAGDTMIATTDAGGHFSLPDSGGGNLLQIAGPGYLQLMYHVPGGSNNLRVKLMPQAVIAGKISDEDGFPVGNAAMEAMRYRLVNGRRILQVAGSVRSDDRGLFRIISLPAGRYYLRATPYGNTVQWDGRYLAHYYRGSFQPHDADRIEVKAGEERTVDFPLTKFEGVTVRGRVDTAEAGIPQGAHVFLQAGGDLRFTQEKPILSDGWFVFRHVPPGNYKLRAGEQWRSSAGRQLAEQRIEVGTSDVNNILFTLRPAEPIDLAGSIAFEDGAEARPIQLTLRPADGKALTVRSEADGSFAFKGLMPDHYDLETLPVTDPGLSARGPAGVPVSARIGSAEVLRSGFDLDGSASEPLRIRMSSALGSLALTVHDPAGAPVAGVQVLLLSGALFDRLSHGTSGVNGVARLAAMAGYSRLYIVPDECDMDVFFDPEWLKAHENDFPPVHITAGANESITVTFRR